MLGCRVCEAEKVPYVNEGLEAIIFTADGDMRQALNNLQATFGGFGLIDQANVFKVCDQPHPLLVSNIVKTCMDADFYAAADGMNALCDLGYSAIDIITTFFKVGDASTPAPFGCLAEWHAHAPSRLAGGPELRADGRVYQARIHPGDRIHTHEDRGRHQLAPAAVGATGQALQTEATGLGFIVMPARVAYLCWEADSLPRRLTYGKERSPTNPARLLSIDRVEQTSGMPFARAVLFYLHNKRKGGARCGGLSAGQGRWHISCRSAGGRARPSRCPLRTPGWSGPS